MLGSLAAAAGLIGREPARAQNVTLRLAAVATDSYAEPFYVRDGGFFAKYGIDVELTPFGTGGQITNAVAGGALDAGIADPIQVGSGFLRGVPFGFFAGGMLYSTNAPTTELCVGKNGAIKTAKDLEGKTVAVNGLKSMAEFAGREWLRQNGADPDLVQFVEIPPAAVPAAVQRGTVAAGMLSEPNLSRAGEYDLIPFGKAFDACAKFFYVDCWFSTRDWLAKNADVAHRLAGAIYDGARWANAHHPETLAILAKYAKLDVDTIRNMHRAQYDTVLDPRRLQPPLDIAWKYHAFDAQLTADQLIVKV